MPRLRRLSGAEAIRIFRSFGFEIHSQNGSHIKMRRENNRLKETLVIPNHDELSVGTLSSILKQASCYIDMNELREIFYSE